MGCQRRWREGVNGPCEESEERCCMKKEDTHDDGPFLSPLAAVAATSNVFPA